MDDQFDAAESHFKKFLELDSDSDLAIKIRSHLNDISEFKKAFSDPSALKRFKYRKRLYQLIHAKTGQDQEKTLDKVSGLIAANPDFYEGYFLLAGLLLDAGKLDDALSIAKQGYDISPDTKKQDLETIVKQIEKEIQYQRILHEASNQLRDREFTKAAAGFKKAFELLPESFEPATLAASAYFQGGEFANATGMYELIRDKGDWENALHAAKQLRLIEPMMNVSENLDTDYSTLNGGKSYIKAFSQFENNQLEEAFDEIDKAIDAITLNPAFSRYYTLRGLVKTRKDDLIGAMNDFEQALEINSGDKDARIQLCSLLQDQEKYLEALSLTRQTPEEYRDLNFYLNKGELELKLEDFTEANISFDQALSLAEDSVNQEIVLSWQAKIAREKGNTEAEIAILERMQKMRPSPQTKTALDKLKGRQSSPPTKKQDSKPTIDFGILDDLEN